MQVNRLPFQKTSLHKRASKQEIKPGRMQQARGLVGQDHNGNSDRGKVHYPKKMTIRSQRLLGQKANWGALLAYEGWRWLPVPLSIASTWYKLLSTAPQCPVLTSGGPVVCFLYNTAILAIFLLVLLPLHSWISLCPLSSPSLPL